MDYDDKLELYLSMGVVELKGVDESGEMIYSINDSAKELAPELWEAHQNSVDQMLLELYDKDLISVEYDENLNAMISLSPDAKKIARDYGLIEFPDEDIPND